MEKIRRKSEEKTKVSIIIPAYNEEKRIGLTLEIYGSFFNKLLREKKLDYELLIVINNTKDKTEDIVKKFQKKNKKIKYLNLKEGGKGFAITRGFKEALKDKKNSLIGFVDADSSTSPESFYDLIEKINGFDGIIASRWIRGSIIKTKQSFLRRFLSRGFNFLVRSLFFMNYDDTQCGAKIFRKEAIQKIIGEMSITKWAFDINLLYLLKSKGLKIIESPTIWEDKGNTKLDVIKVPFEMFSGVVRLRLIYSPFNFVIRLYDGLPEKLKIHHKIK